MKSFLLLGCIWLPLLMGVALVFAGAYLGTHTLTAVGGLIVFAMIIPTKYDPAIRLKEYNETKK